MFLLLFALIDILFTPINHIFLTARISQSCAAVKRLCKRPPLRTAFLLGIHIVCCHIVVYLLAVLLLLALNGVEHRSELFVLELEDAGVIERGGVFFGGEQVGADIAVIFLLRSLADRIGLLEIVFRRRLPCRGLGNFSVVYLRHGVEVSLLNAAEIGQKLA